MPSILITGASTGIGRACAHYFDKAGWQVFAGVRRESDGNDLRAAASERLVPVMLDVTKPAEIAAAAQQVAAEVGDAGLDALVNNAGIGRGAPLEFIDIEDFRWQLEVNVLGQVAVTQAFLPLIRKATGRIVNIGSIGGRIASPLVAPYHASKFALLAISHSLRQELAPFGIHVALVEPGTVSSEIWAKGSRTAAEVRENLPPEAIALYGDRLNSAADRFAKMNGKGIPPERVARVIEHAVTARWPRNRYLVGPDAKILGFIRWMLPDWAMDRLIALDR